MNRLMLLPLVAVLLSGPSQAAQDGDAGAGRIAWEREVMAADGQPRSCVTCHGKDPRRPGKHVRTGKPIAAMAPSVEAQRFSDTGKTSKWFTRNCKWTWGRACSADEQRDIKAYLDTF